MGHKQVNAVKNCLKGSTKICFLIQILLHCNSIDSRDPKMLKTSDPMIHFAHKTWITVL